MLFRVVESAFAAEVVERAPLLGGIDNISPCPSFSQTVDDAPCEEGKEYGIPCNIKALLNTFEACIEVVATKVLEAVERKPQDF